MFPFFDFSKGSVFIGNKFEGFDLAGPSSDENLWASIDRLILFDLISTKSMKWLSIHGPDWDCCVCLMSCGNDEFLILRDKHGYLLTLVDVSTESSDLFEIDASLPSEEFKVYDGFIEVEGSKVVFGWDGDSGCCVIL